MKRRSQGLSTQRSNGGPKDKREEAGPGWSRGLRASSREKHSGFVSGLWPGRNSVPQGFTVRCLQKLNTSVQTKCICSSHLIHDFHDKEWFRCCSPRLSFLLPHRDSKQWCKVATEILLLSWKYTQKNPRGNEGHGGHCPSSSAVEVIQNINDQLTTHFKLTEFSVWRFLQL